MIFCYNDERPFHFSKGIRAVKKLFMIVILIVLILSLVGISANGFVFHEPFNNEYAEVWHTQIYEAGTYYEGFCGISTCGNLATDGPDKYLSLRLGPLAYPGYYTETEYRDLPSDAGLDNGPWTPTIGSPVVLEARIRLPGRNFDGSGDAVGTAGIGLWNNAVGPNGGIHPNTDFLLFSWGQNEMTDFLNLDGFAAHSVVNTFQYISTFRPVSFDIANWFDVRLVWSVDTIGQQTVEYYANGILFGEELLPEPMQGLSLTIWQDNSLFDDTFTEQFPSPATNQYFHIDDIKVYHPN